MRRAAAPGALINCGGVHCGSRCHTCGTPRGAGCSPRGRAWARTHAHALSKCGNRGRGGVHPRGRGVGVGERGGPRGGARGCRRPLETVPRCNRRARVCCCVSGGGGRVGWLQLCVFGGCGGMAARDLRQTWEDATQVAPPPQWGKQWVGATRARVRVQGARPYRKARLARTHSQAYLRHSSQEPGALPGRVVLWRCGGILNLNHGGTPAFVFVSV